MLHHDVSSPMLFPAATVASGAGVCPRPQRSPPLALSGAASRCSAIGCAPVGPRRIHRRLGDIAPIHRVAHPHYTTRRIQSPLIENRRWVSGFVQADLSAILSGFVPLSLPPLRPFGYSRESGSGRRIKSYPLCAAAHK